jgi:hypothetical protein
MKVVIATVGAVIGLVVVGVLGVATAEAPPVTPAPRTVSVQGVATESIAQGSSAAAATAVYRQGMADALSDGQAKAQFLASKAGAPLGQVQSVVEDGGYVGCVGNEGYTGEQPDFGSPSVSIAAAGASARTRTSGPLPAVRNPGAAHKPAKRHRRGKVPSAKHAAVAGCTLSAQVSLVYLMS